MCNYNGCSWSDNLTREEAGSLLNQLMRLARDDEELVSEEQHKMMHLCRILSIRLVDACAFLLSCGMPTEQLSDDLQRSQLTGRVLPEVETLLRDQHERAILLGVERLMAKAG